MKDLTVKRLFDTHSPDTALINIPQAQMDTIWAGLAAICNLNQQLEADSVFLNYCVHQYPLQSFIPPSLDVKVDTTYAWTRGWQRQQTITGYGALDSFLNTYGVTLKYYNLGSSRYEYMNNRAKLVSASPINLFAFADSLRKFFGIVGVERNRNGGDGDHIYYTKDTLLRFAFYAGWGDCPSGCTQDKMWHYLVNQASCSVQLDSTNHFGDPLLPAYMPNCNLRAMAIAGLTVAGSELMIFPNPADQYLQVKVNSHHIPYEITDMSGRRVLNGILPATERIDLRSLSPGIYLIRFEEVGRSFGVRRFYKQ